MRRNEVQSLAVPAIDIPNLASQMRTAFSSMVSNTGCKIAGRAADDLQHLGSRRLLLQRFGEVARALMQLVEQPRVLDGDDGLIGEGLTSSICLSVKGRTCFRASVITPIGIALAQHRNTEQGTEIAPVRCASTRCIPGLRAHR